MIRFDSRDAVYTAIYATVFGILLAVFGLDLRQCVSLGIILAQFHLVLVKIHFRIRR
jgi:hypothetical protein